MATVQEHLETAAATLTTALLDLECALTHAQTRRYPQNWIDAITKARSDTQAVCIHTGNVATCLADRAAPPL